MINVISKFWRLLPYTVRLRLIRITQKTFTVSVVAIVMNPAGEILILDHFIRPGAGWGLPGGFINSNEQPESAIIRELREETALRITDVEFERIRTVGKHIEILYRAKADGVVKLKKSEIRDFGWYSANKLPAGISATQRRLIETTLSRPFH